MAKSKYSNYIESSESANWNVAKGYSELKILRLLLEIDEYRKIANFGMAYLEEEFTTSQEQQTLARLKALKRFGKTLEMLIRNTLFAIRKKHHDKIKDLLDDIIRYQKLLYTCEIKNRSEVNNKNVIKIHERNFAFFLEAFENTHQQLLYPLNESELIFASNDEIDPDELMKKIKEDMIHSG